MKTLMENNYCWESMNDVAEDIECSMHSLKGEFTGTIKITVVYIPEEEEQNES